MWGRKGEKEKADVSSLPQFLGYPEVRNRETIMPEKGERVTKEEGTKKRRPIEKARRQEGGRTTSRKPPKGEREGK